MATNETIKLKVSSSQKSVPLKVSSNQRSVPLDVDSGNPFRIVGVADVQVDNVSVVDEDGTAEIPKSDYNQYGVVQAYENTEPPAGVLVIRNNDKYIYAPQTQYVEGDGFQPIRPHFLPDATTTTKGAMSASDKAKLDSIECGVPDGGTTGQVLSKASNTDYDVEWTTPSGGVSSNYWRGSLDDPEAEAEDEGYDPILGGYARDVTTITGDFTLRKGNRVTIDNVAFWGYRKHFLNIDNTGYKELCFYDSPLASVYNGRYETLISGVTDIEYSGERYVVVDGYSYLDHKHPASSTDYGSVKILEDNNPPAGYVKITDFVGDHYVPTVVGGTETLRAKWLPDFVGTNGVSGGRKGAVPAPTTDDADKFLNADGSWANVAALSNQDINNILT